MKAATSPLESGRGSFAQLCIDTLIAVANVHELADEIKLHWPVDDQRTEQAEERRCQGRSTRRRF